MGGACGYPEETGEILGVFPLVEPYLQGCLLEASGAIELAQGHRGGLDLGIRVLQPDKIDSASIEDGRAIILTSNLPTQLRNMWTRSKLEMCMLWIKSHRGETRAFGLSFLEAHCS